MMSQLPPVAWLIGLPLVGAPVVYLGGRLGGAGLGRLAAVLALLAAGAPLGLAAGGTGTSVTLGAVTFQADGLSLLVVGLTLALALLVVLYDGPDLARVEGAERQYAVLLMVVGAAAGLSTSRDLFNLWIWFEVLALSSYALVCLLREESATLEATVKYMVQSMAGSMLVLLGIALVLAQTGTLALTEIRAAAQPTPALLAAGALLIVGFGVKSALVPLHTWLPDTYATASNGASAILAGAITKLGLVALLRGLAVLAGVSVAWGPVLMVVGVLNVAVGTLLALRQREVRRVLACSSIGHIGYIVLGIGIGVQAGEPTGAQGGLFMFLAHGLMTSLAFLAVGALISATRAEPAGQPGAADRVVAFEERPFLVSDLAGASRQYPLVALTLGLAVLGLAGLPPLAGFMAKWQIFAGGIATRDPLVLGLVVFTLLMVVLSQAYYLPIVSAVYRQQPSTAILAGRPVPAMMGLPLAVLAAAVVALGVWPTLVSDLTASAGAALLAAFAG